MWKGVIYQKQDYSNYIECSEDGVIRNAKTKHEYSQCLGGIGYYQICAGIDGERKIFKVHKSVAETFIPNPEDKLCVNHIDGNKLNNHISNLEWATHKENTEHAIKTGLIKNLGDKSVGQRLKKYGEENPTSKLTDEDVLYIRENYIPRQSGKKCNRVELAEMFGVSPCLIYKIYKLEIWTHI